MNTSLFRINFFGDFVAPNVENLILQDSVKEYLNSADFNVINFEAPIQNKANPIYKSGPNIFQDAKAPVWLESNKFNLISIANNHLFDYGEEGFRQTIQSFTSAKLIGAGTWEEAYTPCILTINSKKIAIISLTHCEFGTLTDIYDNRFSKGCAWVNHPYVDKIITDTRKNVDFLILLSHAGMEEIEQPLPEWRDRYRAFIDLGCDAVIASHPHIPQGWEYYKEKLICYSLGNFYFPINDKNIPSWWFKSLSISIEFKEDGQIHAQIHPIIFKNSEISFDNSSETQNYLQRVNQTLMDSNLYINYINDQCLKHLPNYYDLFSASGFIPSSLKSLIRESIELILKRRSYNQTHLLNNLRCESHRWVISRGIKLLNNIQ